MSEELDNEIPMTAMFHSLQTLGQYTYDNYGHINAQKKSAVEVLEETKPLYVRSPSALKTYSTEDRRADEIYCTTRAPPLKKQERSCDLESKLRRLFDSKDSLGEDFCYKTEVQYKSLPDLSTSSHESFGSTLHHISCTGDEIFSKAETSPTIDTGCSSSEKSYGKPPSLTKSSISMGGSAGKVESKIWRREEAVVNIKLNRSKSDPGETKFNQEIDATIRLERFFQCLGLSCQNYRKLTAASLNGSIPIYFPSGGSTDSTPRGRASGGDQEIITEMELSIVERNARVIKWLVACAKS